MKSHLKLLLDLELGKNLRASVAPNKADCKENICRKDYLFLKSVLRKKEVQLQNIKVVLRTNRIILKELKEENDSEFLEDLTRILNIRKANEDRQPVPSLPR